MKRYFRSYLESYRGLSQPVWMLAIVMLINRTGAMVLPFLGIYMTTQLHFTLEQVGWVLSCFGLGAICGSVAGGWLTDRYGHFRIQATSLFLSVPVFIMLPLFTSQATLSAGIFLLSFITEIFRPANSVSISSYALPANITRAFSLNRMALNLGFSVGPALGGIFAAISYRLLFYGNAFSVGMAGILFYFYFHKREKARTLLNPHAVHRRKVAKGKSPWRDKRFLFFTVLCCFYSICFFQLLGTLPLYYKEIYQLSSWNIGLLLGFNGLVVFLLEMFLVNLSEKRLQIRQVIVLGLMLCSISFVVLPLHHSLFILYLAMFLLSISEIFAMPFMATVAINRSPKNRQGAYMGMNALAFSSAHVLSPYIGTHIAANFSYNTLWIVMASLSFVTALGFAWNLKKMEPAPDAA